LSYEELVIKALDGIYGLGDLSDVFIEVSSGESVKIEDNKLELSTYGLKKGMGLRGGQRGGDLLLSWLSRGEVP